MGLLDKIKKTRKVPELDQPKAAAKAAPEKASEEKSKRIETVKSGDARHGAAYRVLVHPFVSEKAAVGETKGKYTFVVNSHATKEDIKTAVHLIYGVKPTRVSTIQVEGKDVRFGRNLGKRKDWKKAIVTLPKGKTISIHEGV